MEYDVDLQYIQDEKDEYEEYEQYEQYEYEDEDEQQDEEIDTPGTPGAFSFITDINFNFIKSVFTLKKFIFPFTLRKFILWILYILLFLFITQFGPKIVSYIGFADFEGAYIYSRRVWLTNYDILYIIALAIDPFYIMLSVMFGKSTDKDLFFFHPDKNENDKYNVDEFDNVALLISCHNSSDLIEGTLKSALVHFKPENIYVCDNGNSKLPTDDTEEVVFECDPRINYRWVSKGNKNFSQFLAVRNLMKIDDIKYVMVIDDDVKIPDDLTGSIDQMDDVTKGVMYGIKGVDEQGKQESIFTRWQDLEYKVGDFIKKFQTKSTVLFPHGAVSLWEKKAFFRLLGEMDTIFYAEDVKMGLHLLLNGYRLHYNQDCVFETITPSSLFGEAPNFYQQRVRSWDFGEHMMLPRHIRHFFCAYVRGSICKTLMMRISQIYVIMTIFNDWFRIPIIVTYLTYRPGFFLVTLAFMTAINLFSILIYNYWSCRNRPDSQTDLVTIFTSPIYKLVTVIIRLIALCYFIFIYFPNYKPSPVRYPGLISKDKLDEIDSFNLNLPISVYYDKEV